jgi:iron(III) transport system permease protein
MWPRDSSRTWVLGLALVLLLVCCVLPVAAVFVELLHRPELASELLLDGRRRGLLYNTTILGIGVSLGSTVIGVPLGIILARVAFYGKALTRIALAAPAFVPPYVLAWAWVSVASNWFYSLPGSALVLALAFYPLSMLATEVALRRIDGRLEEAAILVAQPQRVLLRVSLPLAAPAVLAAALLIFVLAVSEFGVPGLLRVRVYTTEVFTAFAALYDPVRAAVLTLPLLALCIAVAVVAAVVLADRLVTTGRTLSAPSSLITHWRTPSVSFALLVMSVALIAPLMMLGSEAAGVDSPSAVVAGSSGAILNSVALAAVGATLVVAVALGLGYLRARTVSSGRLIDVLLVVLFAIPGTVIGVGLIDLWNRPGIPGIVYDSNGMFLLAYLARFVPVAALMLAATVRSVPVAHEETAAVSGASWLRTVAQVVMPQMRLGIAAAWIVVFVLAFGELGVTILVAPPGDATLPIRIYTMIANSPPSHVALFALLQTAIVLTAVVTLGVMASIRQNR